MISHFEDAEFNIVASYAKEIVYAGETTYTFKLQPQKSSTEDRELFNVVLREQPDKGFDMTVVYYDFSSTQAATFRNTGKLTGHPKILFFTADSPNRLDLGTIVTMPDEFSRFYKAYSNGGDDLVDGGELGIVDIENHPDYGPGNNVEDLVNFGDSPGVDPPELLKVPSAGDNGGGGGAITTPVDDNDSDNEGCPCTTSKEDLEKAFKGANSGLLQVVADAINDYGADFGIDTDAKLQNFLAQAAVETGNFATLNVTENLNYSAQRLTEVWPTRFSFTDTTKLNPNDYAHNPEKLANEVYAGRNGNRTYGDGWLYRGRGIFQITGKAKYEGYGDFLDNHPDIDVEYNGPEDISSGLNAVLSAMWYFKHTVLSQIDVDSGTNADEVTDVVDPGTTDGSKQRRRSALSVAKTNIEC